MGPDAQSSLAIVLRPRGGDLLEDALLGLRRDGVDTLVSMLEEWEADFLGLAEEPHLAVQSGMTFLSFPIPDRGAPTDIHLGWSPLAALKKIESARGCSVPDTDEQREWIIRYGGRH